MTLHKCMMCNTLIGCISYAKFDVYATNSFLNNIKTNWRIRRQANTRAVTPVLSCFFNSLCPKTCKSNEISFSNFCMVTLFPAFRLTVTKIIYSCCV